MSDKNLICITSYSNPDLLWICLNQLRKCNTFQNYGIRIFTEEGYDKEIDEVIQMFSGFDISLKVREKHKNCPLVGFHNILETYKDGYNECSEYCIFLEDDIIPTEDFLQFNDYVYKNYLKKFDRIFCVGHKRRPENHLEGKENILMGDYQMTSPSCVSKETIGKYILPHLTSDLYDDPVSYYFKNFSDSRIPWHSFTHHDCFLERIMWKNKLFGLKPDLAISGHIGLRGIHCKGEPPTGSLTERIEKYILLMNNIEELKSLSTSPNDLVVPPSWVRGGWVDLILDTERNLSKASSWFYDMENEFKKYINNNKMEKTDLDFSVFKGGWSYVAEEIENSFSLLPKNQSDLNVIEFGCGNSSIKLFDLLSSKWNVKYTAYETNPDYLVDKIGINCILYDVKNIKNLNIGNEKYDFILIDGPNGEHRKHWYSKLVNNIKTGSVILIDDWCHYKEFEDALINDFGCKVPYNIIETRKEYDPNSDPHLGYKSWKIVQVL